MTNSVTQLTLGCNTIVIPTAVYLEWDTVLCDDIFNYGEENNFVMYYDEASGFSKQFNCRTATYLLGHPDVQPNDTVIVNGCLVQLKDLCALDVFIGCGAKWADGLVVSHLDIECDFEDEIPF